MIIAATLIFTIALVGTPVFLIINAVRENREIKNATVKRSQPAKPVAQLKSTIVV